MRNLLAVLACTGAALLLTGCEAKIYRAETALQADGTIERAIYQPASETPPAVREASVWTGSTNAARVPHEKWSGSIADLPPATPDKKRPYFAGWGRFASSEDVPRSFWVEAPEGYPDGTLALEVTRDDWGLVTEYLWNETLTDIVTLDDLREARQELASRLIPVAEKILDKALGQEYDTRGVGEWLRGSCAPLVFDLTDAYFDRSVRKDGSENKYASYAKVFKRHGVTLPQAEGRTPSPDDLQPMLAAYARNALQEKLRRRDGQPTPVEVVDEIMIWAGLDPQPEGVERSERLDAAAKSVIIDTFGGDDGVNKTLKPLVQRILGLYRADFGGLRRFDYTLEMPGPIVETTGQLLTDRKVRWRFTDSDAYPGGYRMQCRALVANNELVGKLVGGAGLDRQQLNQYLDLVRDNSPLLAVMRMCAVDGSLERLRRERDALVEAEDASAASYTAMLELLSGRPN